MVHPLMVGVGSYALLEVFLHLFLQRLRKRFANIIITSKDALPEIPREGLEKFLKHGFDPELGWVRKPGTRKVEKSYAGDTEYSITGDGSRANPGHDHLSMLIDTFGDSYTFCRHTNDDETWQFFLAKRLNVRVTNFGVGNYGLDQALLRFTRELPRLKGRILLIGIVPETIKRNLSVWKHYNEFGNILGFKPRFKLVDGKLVLVPNPINSEEKFQDIKSYLPGIQKEDYFYKEKFRKCLFSFPYVLSILKNPKKKLSLLAIFGGAYLMELLHIDWKNAALLPKEKIVRSASFDLKDRISFYGQSSLIVLTVKILEQFACRAKKKGMHPVFVMFPEYDDLRLMQQENRAYYQPLLDEAEKFLPALDVGASLRGVKDIKSIYSNRDYGGHYNAKGNALVAKIILAFLKKRGLVKES